ncbi:hypothetical protein V495_04839 [Pseudogymnoascus sp. VKM F-4514 (FW-929)]|nr:hypothetical protein V490_06840 [Pseudogymnoascus sp. VKM F-3557]KFY41654.1 hypothetical protein V495_04839 [Pseudogymnoascus sp. VKM F-4514 (FW-929)]KFY63463.1 hypothetical protein V497_01991 [Pseudogymnoascus sp. VKM F-4516 (FW-969)]
MIDYYSEYDGKAGEYTPEICSTKRLLVLRWGQPKALPYLSNRRPAFNDERSSPYYVEHGILRIFISRIIPGNRVG